jgi:uncharacterized protein with HEPN domain
MDNETNKLLVDILICIKNVDNYLGPQKRFEEYNQNSFLQDAVERNFITIGEAVNQLLKIKPDIAISDARRIVNLRNLLTHGYDAVENVMVWNIIFKSLPNLRTEIENLLNGVK